MSVKSSKTTTSSAGVNLSSLQQEIDNLKKQKITFQGKAMLAVSSAAVDSLQKRVGTILVDFDTVGEKEKLAISLNNQIQELRSQLDKTLAVAEDLDAQKSLALADLQKAQAALRAKEQLFETKKLEMKSVFADLQAQVKVAQAEASAAKAEKIKTKNGFDPDAAIEAQDRHAKAALEVTDLNNRLQQYKQHVATQEADLKKYRDQVALLEEQKSQAAGAATQIRNALAAGQGAPSGPLQLSPKIEAFLGKDACAILANWHNLAFNNAREKAYTVQAALRKSPSRLAQAIGSLVYKVFSWLKEVGNKIGRVALPFVNLIVAHLKAGGLKAWSFYRAELDKIKNAKLQLYLQSKKSKPTDTHDDMSFLDDMWFYGYAIALRVKRKSTSLFAKTLTSVRTALYWAGSFFKRESSIKAGKRPVAYSAWSGWFPSVFRPEGFDPNQDEKELLFEQNRD